MTSEPKIANIDFGKSIFGGSEQSEQSEPPPLESQKLNSGSQFQIAIFARREGVSVARAGPKSPPLDFGGLGLVNRTQSERSLPPLPEGERRGEERERRGEERERREEEREKRGKERGREGKRGGGERRGKDPSRPVSDPQKSKIDCRSQFLQFWGSKTGPRLLGTLGFTNPSHPKCYIGLFWVQLGPKNGDSDSRSQFLTLWGPKSIFAEIDFRGHLLIFFAVLLI